MITKARSVGIYVGDQQRALEFYRDTLGFEVLADTPMGEASPEDDASDARWIEVAPPGAQTVLVLYTPPQQRDRIGGFSNIVFDTDDILATFEELKGRGVEFTQEPSHVPWGWWAQFRDSEGNEFGVVQSGV